MKSVIIYGTPAHGHINPTLYLVEKLLKNNYKVIYYALDEFKDKIIKSGAVYKKYEFNSNKIDLQDGSRILKFYRLLLEYTNELIDGLLEECEVYKPSLIIHDSVATWGRHVAHINNIPSASFNSIITINSIFSKASFLYSISFMRTFFLYMNEIYEIKKYKRILKQKYKLKKLGMIDTIMNKENLNIMAFAREMQPGGEKFDDTYFFLGPSSIYRNEDYCDNFDIDLKNIIYVSLGTIFNNDVEFFNILFSKLRNTRYTVVVSIGCNTIDIFDDIPDNFIVRNYVNQSNVLKNSVLFITAGGMNSINEAIKYNVPCLVYPKQGEQNVNSLMLKKLKMGDIIKDINNIDKQIADIINNYHMWDYTLAEKITKVNIEDLIKKIDDYIK